MKGSDYVHRNDFINLLGSLKVRIDKCGTKMNTIGGKPVRISGFFDLRNRHHHCQYGPNVPLNLFGLNESQ